MLICEIKHCKQVLHLSTFNAILMGMVGPVVKYSGVGWPCVIHWPTLVQYCLHLEVGPTLGPSIHIQQRPMVGLSDTKWSTQKEKLIHGSINTYFIHLQFIHRTHPSYFNPFRKVFKPSFSNNRSNLSSLERSAASRSLHLCRNRRASFYSEVKQ